MQNQNNTVTYKGKNQYTFESFYLSNDLPLDAKTIISSIDNLNVELPVNHRYLGLIFFTKTEKKFYTFRNDINTAELFINDANVSNTFGIYVDNYSQILTELNKYISLGKIIFVFPLNVAFIYNGTNWEYYSGIYNIRTGVDYNNIPNQIKKIGIKVNYNGLKIWNENLLVSDFYLKTNLPENKAIFDSNSQPIEDRIYIHRNELYRVVNNKKVKFGNYLQEITNFTVNVGETKIKEFLFTDVSEINTPPYIKAIIWKTGYPTVFSNTTHKYYVDLEVQIKQLSDRFEYWVLSDQLHNGTLELRT